MLKISIQPLFFSVMGFYPQILQFWTEIFGQQKIFCQPKIFWGEVEATALTAPWL